MATTKPALSGKTTPAIAPKIISDGNEREAFDQMLQRMWLSAPTACSRLQRRAR